jgi:Holliday junction resolvase RusA-like endonuclease
MAELNFIVYGRPQPAGSKRAFPAGGKPGARTIVVDASKKSKPWKENIAQEAGAAVIANDWELQQGPLWVRFTFWVNRPKGHYGTGRNAAQVKAGAPPFPATKPDALKLARAVEDALTGIVYRDDAQIVTGIYLKRYGSPEGVSITVRSHPAAWEGVTDE